MRIGYAKAGRSMKLVSDKWGMVGGDQEPIVLLRKLAAKYPQHTFVLVGRNSGEKPEDIGLPVNVVNPFHDLKHVIPRPRAVKDSVDARNFSDDLYSYFRDMMTSIDAMVLWSGQHGTSNTPIPKVGYTWDAMSANFTKPQTSFLNYCSYLIRGINDWRTQTDGKQEEIWICTDARNTIKCRDLKWPLKHPVLGLFEDILITKHERWKDYREPSTFEYEHTRWVGEDDPGVWYARTRYIYSAIEVATILPYATRIKFEDLPTFDSRRPLGLIVNEARAYVELDRKSIIKEWILPLRPTFIHGEWSDESLKEMGCFIEPVSHRHAFDRLSTVRTTLTTPSSGSGWATRKPWESFASGTICFFHPAYDTQGLIIPTLDQLNQRNYGPAVVKLTSWLRTTSKADFWKKCKEVVASSDLYAELAHLQWQLYQAALKADRFMNLLDERIKEAEKIYDARKAGLSEVSGSAESHPS